MSITEAPHMPQRLDGLALSAVLPAHNEEHNLAAVVVPLAGVLRRLPLHDWEIVIVNDGSTDRTGETAEQLVRGDPGRIRVIHSERNEGYGAALKRGFDATRHSVIFYMDADGQCDVEALHDLLQRLDDADLATGYRLNRADPWPHRVVSKTFNWMVRAVFGVSTRDANCPFRLVRRCVLESLTLESTQGFFSAELLVKTIWCGFRVAAMGIPHYPRRAGRSMFQLRTIYHTLWECFRVRRSLGPAAHDARRRMASGGPASVLRVGESA